MNRLRIRDVVFTRSTGWTLLMYDCQESVLERVRVLGYFTNADGSVCTVAGTAGSPAVSSTRRMIATK